MWRDAATAEGRGGNHDIAAGLREHVAGSPRPSVTYRDGKPAEIHPAGGPESATVRPGPPDGVASAERPGDEQPAVELDLLSQIAATYGVPPHLIHPRGAPRTVAEAATMIESLAATRHGNHRPGTGPAYRAEGEQNAFALVLNLLRTGNPEGREPEYPSIECPSCHRVSHHPQDVANRYCRDCGFHDDLPRGDHDEREHRPPGHR